MEADLSSCQAWFAEAGWGAEPFTEPSLAVWDARVDLLLKRVQAAAEGKPDRWALLQAEEPVGHLRFCRSCCVLAMWCQCLELTSVPGAFWWVCLHQRVLYSHH